jgi:hypothetical protein
MKDSPVYNDNGGDILLTLKPKAWQEGLWLSITGAGARGSQ